MTKGVATAVLGSSLLIASIGPASSSAPPSGGAAGSSGPRATAPADAAAAAGPSTRAGAPADAAAGPSTRVSAPADAAGSGDRAPVPAATAWTRTGRLASPRRIEPARSFTMAPGGERSAGLGAGKPGKLLMLDSWITSDYMPDDAMTAELWYDLETLTIIAGFYSQTSANVTATVDVMSDTGPRIFTQSFTGAPYAAHTNITALSLGALPAGYYRIRFKLKQGTASIGQQFWIHVETYQP